MVGNTLAKFKKKLYEEHGKHHSLIVLMSPQQNSIADRKQLSWKWQEAY